jgi:hypothetical protein
MTTSGYENSTWYRTDLTAKVETEPSAPLYSIEDEYNIPPEFNLLVKSTGLDEYLEDLGHFVIAAIRKQKQLEQAEHEDARHINEMLKRLIMKHDRDVYNAVWNEVGPEYIPLRLWWLINMSSDWYGVTGPTFTDMPKNIFEKFFRKYGTERMRTMNVHELHRYTSQRSDKYGKMTEKQLDKAIKKLTK